MRTLLQLEEMPSVRGITVPEDFYVVLASPALLAGMRRPLGNTPWSKMSELGFRHVICLAEGEPYDPSPMNLAYNAVLEDLELGNPPKDPDREESLIRDAVEVAVTHINAGDGVVVHCAGGTGRTGTVIGCVLRELGIQGQTVVRYLDDLNRRGRGRPGWPESDWQAELVLRY